MNVESIVFPTNIVFEDPHLSSEVDTQEMYVQQDGILHKHTQKRSSTFNRLLEEAKREAEHAVRNVKKKNIIVFRLFVSLKFLNQI